MDEKILMIKRAVIAAFYAGCMLIGWRGILLIVWLCMMALDWVSGSQAAKRNDEWDSAISREGIYHKRGMIIAVATAVLADLVLYGAVSELPLGIDWPVLIFPMVTLWYVVTEFGSILENVTKMGVPVPEWLTKGLAITKKKLDTVADDTFGRRGSDGD